MPGEFTRVAERETLLRALHNLNKQQVDALYRLADIESAELQQIRLLADKIRERLGRMQDRDRLLNRTLKSLERLVDAYMVEQQALPIELEPADDADRA